MMKNIIFSGFLLIVLSGCERENLNDKPISYWIDDGDTCVSGTAQAIVNSGLPYPNFTYEARINDKTGKEEQRVKTVDVWLGNERFAFPREYVSSHGGYATTHPRNTIACTVPCQIFTPRGRRPG